MDNYILVGYEPVLEPDFVRWASFMEGDRMVARTGNEHVVVSTVFLGIDHNYLGVGPPLLFETMVFGGPHDGEMNRYATWVEAETGHAEMVASVFPALIEGERR